MPSYRPVILAGSTLIDVARPPVESLPVLRELGFDRVELAFYEGWSAVGPSELADHHHQETLRRGLDAGGLDAVALNVGVEGLSASAAARAVADCLTLAHGLAAPIVTVQAEPLFELSSLVRAAQRAGITLAVETHAGYVTESPEGARRLLDAVPGLGLTLDPSHFAFVGRDLDEPEIGALFSLAVHAHYRDAAEGTLQVRPGDGAVDAAAFRQRLGEAGFSGAVTVEYIDAPADAAAARRLLEGVPAGHA